LGGRRVLAVFNPDLLASAQSSGNCIRGEQCRVLPVDTGLAEIFFIAPVSPGKSFPGKFSRVNFFFKFSADFDFFFTDRI